MQFLQWHSAAIFSLLVCKALAQGRFQAEDGIWYKAGANNRYNGFDGSGYIDNLENGGYVRWTVDVHSAGEHDITIGYSSASNSGGHLDLVVDGDIRQTYAIPSTDTWTNWKTETHTLTLTPGSHDFRAKANHGEGPILDWIEIYSTNHPDTKEKGRQNSSIKALGGNFARSVVLKPDERLEAGEFAYSPNGQFSLGLSESGNFELRKGLNNEVIWSADGTGGYQARLYMQGDGNCRLKNVNRQSQWSSKTSKNYGARLVVDDGGHAAIISSDHDTPLWLVGVPRGTYNGPSSSSLNFPIRAAFYYPWYPETWTVGGKYARFKPSLGYYSSGDPKVAVNHVDSLEYAHVQLSIASWWGQGSKLDRPRISLLMDESINTNVKWSVYHERENHIDQTPNEIRNDLDYLKTWFAWHQAWAHIDGKPVIFVYNDSNGGCDVPRRWMQASNNEWYVVLKVFPDYKDCPDQPDSWHQYGPGSAVVDERNSFGISPGFWRADLDPPKLPRVDEQTWCKNVQGMVESEAPWRLITTFNEAGEGTMIEASDSWASDSGYGFYLDALHNCPDAENCDC